MQPANLQPHPEGGRFREVFKSSARVITASGTNRSALTHIYFSLEPGEVSRFHRVAADEVWNLYQGEGLRLHLWRPTDPAPRTVTLSPASGCFCQVVEAGTWQAAEPLADTVLVGCSVAPGFEYADFELIDPASEQALQLQTLAPWAEKLIRGV